MLIQNMFVDRNSPMLVMCDHTFLFFSGIPKTIHMGDKMTNHMRGLNNNKIWFIAIIDHKKRVYIKKNLW